MVIKNKLLCVQKGLLAGLFAALLFSTPPSARAAGAFSGTISSNALKQISAFVREKSTRSLLHRKLDSALVYKLKAGRQQFALPDNAAWKPHLKYAADGRVLVDIKAEVTEKLLGKIKQSGGSVLHSHSRYKTIRALVPLNQIENLAASQEVTQIRQAVPVKAFAGSVDSQGDATHGALPARTQFNLSGKGVKIGVLSDSIDFLADSQSAGDLPANVVVLDGQSGMPGSGEGTAMLEIIHDLAPGAQLYFATAYTSESGFAQNILDLRSHGCDIIVDDVLYFNESPFQDGIIAQAINSVTASGALYFSSAGNSGRWHAGTSATWEGDFCDGGMIASNSLIGGLGEGGSRLHNFGTNNYNQIQDLSAGDVEYVSVFWSDPLGASTNDYDLFVLTPDGSEIYDYSGGPQTGTEDPFEICTATNGCQIVIVKFSGADRFLHVQLMVNGYGTLSGSTAGSIIGHTAATNAFCVAAVDASAAYPGLFTKSDAVEYFSADGPRRIFFNADGSPVTPDNFTSTGGALRPKPDLTAADGVRTSVPGFAFFYGTSAAAPHAAAMAALLLSYVPGLTHDQLSSVFAGTALDIGIPGMDNESGVGIIMANLALPMLAKQYYTPTIQTVTMNDGMATVTWNAPTNHAYQVQYSTNLATGIWHELAISPTVTNGIMSVTDDNYSLQKYYRLELLY